MLITDNTKTLFLIIDNRLCITKRYNLTRLFFACYVFICYDAEIGVDDAVVTTTTTTSQWIIEKTSITIENNYINILNKLDNCNDIKNNIPQVLNFYNYYVICMSSILKMKMIT